MRISLIQMPVKSGAVRENLACAAHHLDEAIRRRSEFILLPEMWSTGFAYREFPGLAQEALPETLRLLQSTARKAGAWVSGTLPEVEGKKVYNTMFWLDPTGRIAGRYQKVHLFPPMGEDERLAPGRRLLTVETPFGRLGGCICFDIRFPELARRLAIEGAKLLAVPAQFPHPRRDHWLTLLKARAIENQCFVAAANIVGRDGRLEFFGASRLIDPWGEEIAGGEEEEGVITAEIDLSRADQVRSQLPAFAVRRPDVYGDLAAPE
ncbi:MAG TPA: carbon-nitrogen family hydrolase [Limnochordia bacterium]|nr:carbon-nitrogen family hydrolase [Limnochordia bacterium]